MTAVTAASLARVAATHRDALVSKATQAEEAAVTEAKYYLREGCLRSAVGVLLEAAPILHEFDEKLCRHDAGQRPGWRVPRERVAAGLRAVGA